MGNDLRASLWCDSGPDAGLGHLKRMQALANALTLRGVPASVGAVGSDPAPVTVVDSYRQDVERPLSGVTVLAAVDDVGRDLDVDVLVDPNPPPFPERGRADVLLTGVRYALIDPELARTQSAEIAEVATVLVAAGAADSSGYGLRIAREVAALRPGWRVRAVAGQWGRADAPVSVEVLNAPESLADALSGADLVVTAGGVTMLEALALGRPTVAFEIAPNQRRALAGAANSGAAVVSSIDDAAEAALALADDRVLRQQLSSRASAYVDGLGADRVAEVLVGRL